MIRNDHIRELRKARKWTVVQLAERVYARCGIGSQAQVRRWEAGTSQPGLIAAHALADVFGVKLANLVDRDARPPKPTKGALTSEHEANTST